MPQKLYPPYIEGTIPAFYGTEEGGEITYRLTVPFSMNKGVGLNEVAGYQLKIKTIQSNQVIYNSWIQDSLAGGHGEITFIFTKNDLLIEEDLEIGQYFKLQLAYVGLSKQPDTGYFSTVGVTKLTTKPEIYIEGMSMDTTNTHKMSYTGVYKQNQDGADTSEKLYSSEFIIYDENYSPVLSSNDLIHNVIKDENVHNESSEEWRHGRGLPEDEYFYVKWIVTTSNKLKLETPYYKIMDKNSAATSLRADLIAESNFDNGYVTLSLKGHINEFGNEDRASGLFLLSRANSKTNYQWEELYRFSLYGEEPSRILFKDFTIEQGVHYQYAIQQYNVRGLYSDRVTHKTYDDYGNLTDDLIFSDFEDIFLYDGERQLKIRFNPQVSSFNRTIQEQQVTTMGSQFPFFFRNGATDYKTFPISGLISYLMDEEKLFMIEEDPTDDYIVRTHTSHISEKVSKSSTALTSENIAAERNFKMKVLEWLTNGEPKLFRSPTEGNFIVRLTNVSLSPNQQLSRMIHTFSAQAVEVSKYNYETLNKLGFIHIDMPSMTQKMWKSVLLKGRDEGLYRWVKQAVIGSQVPERYYYTIKNTLWGADADTTASQYFSVTGSTITVTAGFRTEIYQKGSNGEYIKVNGKLKENPYGDLQSLILQNPTYAAGKLNDDNLVLDFTLEDMLPGSVVSYTSYDPANTGSNGGIHTTEIYIGSTGTYTGQAPEGGYISEISIPEYARYSGLLTYGYEGVAPSSFDLVADVEIIEVPLQQFIGPVVGKEYYYNTAILERETDNIVKMINDCRTDIIKYINILAYKKETQDVYVKWANGKLAESTEKIDGNSTLTIPKLYLDSRCTDRLTQDNIDEFTVYRIRKYDSKALEGASPNVYYQFDARHDEYYSVYGYLEGKSKVLEIQSEIPLEWYDFTFNNDIINVYQIGSFELSNIENVDTLKISKGVILDLVYYAREIEYAMESDATRYGSLVVAKQAWLNAKQALQTALDNLNTNADALDRIPALRSNVADAYDEYLRELTLALALERSVYES